MANNSTNRTLHITEDIFVSLNLKLGSEFACAVTAYDVIGGSFSKRSNMSANFFAGIKVHTPQVTFDAMSTGVITIEPTIPIGCDGSQDCKLILHTYMPDGNTTCTALAFRNLYCGVYLFSSNYSEVINIPITATDNTQIIVMEEDRHMVYLRTDNTVFNKIWQNYELEGIPVTIIYGNGSTGVCRVFNDPHYTTFDGRRYENHDDGTKILYRNVLYNTEIQAQFTQCNVPGTKCLCGVAVKAGFDVYIWSVCDGSVRMGYLHCNNAERSLFVKKINDKVIKITFAYGTYIRLIQDRTFIQMFLYPSNKDHSNTVGMCGTFDDDMDNDFHFSNGTSMGNAYHTLHPDNKWTSFPTEFGDIWTVSSDTENFFSDNFDESILQKHVNSYCICTNTTSNVEGTDIINGTIPCTPAGEVLCSLGELLSHSNCDFISTKSRRRRRSQSDDGKGPLLLPGKKVRVPTVKVTNMYQDPQRMKREMGEVAWTEEQAREYCEKHFNENIVYKLCSQVPEVNPETSIDVCVADIQLTNTTDWVYPSMHTMAESCYEELLRTVSIIKAEAMGKGDPIYGKIKMAACINNCSEIGECVEGKCICPPGIGGSDCSVDMTMPVTITSLLDDGVCDTRQSDCSRTFIYGGAFVDSETLLCKVQEFKEDVSGLRMLGETYKIHPHVETFVELILSLPKSSTPAAKFGNHGEPVVSGYSISVTNDGKTYSRTTDFYKYDSDCQWVDEVNGKFLFSIEPGFCFIDNKCLKDGLVNRADRCYYCNSTLAQGEWSIDNSDMGCVPHGIVQSNGLNVIAVGTITSAIILTSLALLFCIMTCLRTKQMASNTTLVSYKDA
jgi:hypothetical protein